MSTTASGSSASTVRAAPGAKPRQRLAAPSARAAGISGRAGPACLPSMAFILQACLDWKQVRGSSSARPIWEENAMSLIAAIRREYHLSHHHRAHLVAAAAGQAGRHPQHRGYRRSARRAKRPATPAIYYLDQVMSYGAAGCARQPLCPLGAGAGHQARRLRWRC